MVGLFFKINKEGKMKITPREKEMREQYKIIYKNLKIKFPKTDELVRDEITGIVYLPSLSDQRKKIKHSRTIIKLINLYRKDFPMSWEKTRIVRDEIKQRSYEMLSEKDICGFEMLIKAWWARKIRLDIDPKNLEEIDEFISFDEHMKKTILNILYIKKETNGWEGIDLLHIKRMLDEKNKLDLYFDYLVKKYRVDINDPNFIPEKNLDFIASY